MTAGAHPSAFSAGASGDAARERPAVSLVRGGGAAPHESRPHPPAGIVDCERDGACPWVLTRAVRSRSSVTLWVPVASIVV